MNVKEKWRLFKNDLRNLVAIGIALLLFIPLIYIYHLFNKKPTIDDVSTQNFVLNLKPHIYNIPGKNRVDKQCRFFVKEHVAKFVSPIFSDSSILKVRKELNKDDTIFVQVRKSDVAQFGTVSKEIIIESLSSKQKNYYDLVSLEKTHRKNFQHSVTFLLSVGMLLIVVGLLSWKWN